MIYHTENVQLKVIYVTKKARDGSCFGMAPKQIRINAFPLYVNETKTKWSLVATAISVDHREIIEVNKGNYFAGCAAAY